jgi:hypothetical protein
VDISAANPTDKWWSDSHNKFPKAKNAARFSAATISAVIGVIVETYLLLISNLNTCDPWQPGKKVLTETSGLLHSCVHNIVWCVWNPDSTSAACIVRGGTTSLITSCASVSEWAWLWRARVIDLPRHDGLFPLREWEKPIASQLCTLAMDSAPSGEGTSNCNLFWAGRAKVHSSGPLWSCYKNQPTKKHGACPYDWRARCRVAANQRARPNLNPLLRAKLETQTLGKTWTTDSKPHLNPNIRTKLHTVILGCAFPIHTAAIQHSGPA